MLSWVLCGCLCCQVLFWQIFVHVFAFVVFSGVRGCCVDVWVVKCCVARCSLSVVLSGGCGCSVVGSHCVDICCCQVSICLSVFLVAVRCHYCLIFPGLTVPLVSYDVKIHYVINSEYCVFLCLSEHETEADESHATL